MTEGALRGEVLAGGAGAVSGVLLTLEDESGVQIRQFHTDSRGRFNLPLLAPGRYALVVEKAGFQPLRQHAIRVVADAVTHVTVRLIRRPPPITSIEEVAVADQQIRSTSPRVSEAVGGLDNARFGARTDIAADGANTALVADPRDTRWGFARSFGGLPQSSTRLLVDGLPASWFRHPAVPADPAPAPAFPRFLFSQVQVAPHATDGEWGGGNAGVVSAVSRSAATGFRFEPFAFWSGKPGVPSVQNPEDSSLTSFQAGGVLSATMVEHRARVLAGFSYEEVTTPTARPWERDSASFAGAAVPLAGGLAAVSRDSFGVDVTPYVHSRVRTYRGGSGGLRLDWRLSDIHTIIARADFARFKERNPDLGQDVLTGAEATTTTRDFSAEVALVSAWKDYANEFRVGARANERDWLAPRFSTTYLVAEGAGVGARPEVPGDFRRTSYDFSETFQYAFGPSGEHRLKMGGQYSNGIWRQNYLYGKGGIFRFGDLDQFGRGEGTYYRAEVPNDRVRFNFEDLGLYAQLQFQVLPRLAVLGGLRWDRQILPKPATTPIRPDSAFAAAFGISNAGVPNDKSNFGPRVGFLWDGGPNHEWSGSLGLGRYFGALSPATFSDAVLADGAVTVQRGLGSFATWPAAPDSATAPYFARRFTLFGPSGQYKNPRTFKADLQIARNLPGFTTARFIGGYHHTDFLLRTTDLNLLGSPLGTTQEGRPVYGTLVQQGGMLTAAPGSNRRIQGYDLVSALASTGFSNYYQAGVSLSREATRGVSFSASYLWSRTRDNWLQSWNGNPADALSPFPADRPGREWAEGISDFDVPHRVTVLASWRSGGSTPVSIGARYRYRSGFPYTPGFQPGVDANGDGSGANDPAFVDPGIPGITPLLNTNPCLKDQTGHFAARNSCREAGNHALDLNLAVGLPFHSLGGRLELLLDVFNLASTATGVVDRALVLVDPAGTVTTDAQGNIVLPLVANPHFGKLLSRRTAPRVVRFGLQLVY